jgi:hypothetical protein
VHFYDIGGRLVRRWVTPQRRRAIEVWIGTGWTPYAEMDDVLRYGRRLTDLEAIALLQQTRAQMEIVPAFSDEEAHTALNDRLRRA